MPEQYSDIQKGDDEGQKRPPGILRSDGRIHEHQNPLRLRSGQNPASAQEQRRVFLVIDNLPALEVNMNPQVRAEVGRAMTSQGLTSGPSMGDPQEVRVGDRTYSVCNVEPTLSGGHGILVFDKTVLNGNKYYVCEKDTGELRDNERMEGFTLPRETSTYLAHPIFEDLRNQVTAVSGFLMTIELSLTVLPGVAGVFKAEDVERSKRDFKFIMPGEQVAEARRRLLDVANQIDYEEMLPDLQSGVLFENLNPSLRTQFQERVQGSTLDQMLLGEQALSRLNPETVPGDDAERQRLQMSLGARAVFEALFDESERRQILSSRNPETGEATWGRYSGLYVDCIQSMFPEVLNCRGQLMARMIDMRERVANGTLNFLGIDWDVFKSYVMHSATVDELETPDYESMIYGENGIMARQGMRGLRCIITRNRLDVGVEMQLPHDENAPAVITDDAWEAFTAGRNPTELWRQIQTVLGGKIRALHETQGQVEKADDTTLGAQEIVEEFFSPPERRRLLHKMGAQYVFRTDEAQDAAMRLSGRDFMVAVFDDIIESLKEDEIYLSQDAFTQVNQNFLLFTDAYTRSTNSVFHAGGEGGSGEESTIYRGIHVEADRRRINIDTAIDLGILPLISEQSETLASEWVQMTPQQKELFFRETPAEQLPNRIMEYGRAFEARSPAHAIRFYREILETDFEENRILEVARQGIETSRQRIRGIDEIGVIDTVLGAVMSMASRTGESDEPGPSTPARFPPEYSLWAGEDGLTREVCLIAGQLSPAVSAEGEEETPVTNTARNVARAAYMILDNSLTEGERRNLQTVRERLGEIILGDERRQELVSKTRELQGNINPD